LVVGHLSWYYLNGLLALATLVNTTQIEPFLFVLCHPRLPRQARCRRGGNLHYIGEKLTGVGVDLDVDGHENVGGAAGVGDSPSGDGGGGSGREFVVSGGKSHSLDFAENGK